MTTSSPPIMTLPLEATCNPEPSPPCPCLCLRVLEQWERYTDNQLLVDSLYFTLRTKILCRSYFQRTVLGETLEWGSNKWTRLMIGRGQMMPLPMISKTLHTFCII